MAERKMVPEERLCARRPLTLVDCELDFVLLLIQLGQRQLANVLVLALFLIQSHSIGASLRRRTVG